MLVFEILIFMKKKQEIAPNIAIYLVNAISNLGLKNVIKFLMKLSKNCAYIII